MSKNNIAIASLRENPDNPRTIEDSKLEQLKKSISEFPKMMKLRPIIVDNDMMVLGGNMRLKALTELGYKEIPEEWVMRAEELTEEQKKEFIIKDNTGFGQWDWPTLRDDWDVDLLKDWGLEVPLLLNYMNDGFQGGTLSDDFTIPPFTILDTRAGTWIHRKQEWNARIQDTGETREMTLYHKSSILSDFKKGVSILDPVLAEIALKWFAPQTGDAFDPFAGDSVFGYVANELGFNFTGIELRQEQCDLNNERLSEGNSKYICDDGRNVHKHLKKESQDFMFSCPPYFDLEKYSDLPDDASNQGTYEEFLDLLNTAFGNAIKCLKKDKFAVVVVGDIRGEEQYYRGFPDDVKRIFREHGMGLFNEMILINQIGTTRLIARNNMTRRKVVKVHQNVLVFYHGDVAKVKTDFPTIKADYEQINEEQDESKDLES